MRLPPKPPEGATTTVVEHGASTTFVAAVACTANGAAVRIGATIPLKPDISGDPTTIRVSHQGRCLSFLAVQREGRWSYVAPVACALPTDLTPGAAPVCAVAPGVPSAQDLTLEAPVSTVTGETALRVRDSHCSVLRGFSGMEYFPYSAAWRIQARFIPSNPPEKLLQPNILNQTGTEVISHGKLAFTTPDGSLAEIVTTWGYGEPGKPPSGKGGFPSLPTALCSACEMQGMCTGP